MTASDKPFGLTRIAQIAVNVKDIQKAVAFYRDVLGMTFLFEAPPQLAFFDCGGIRLMLTTAESPELDHPSNIIYYSVPDIQAAASVLKSRGVAFITEPHFITKLAHSDLWLADFRDSSQNILALMSEVPHAV